MVSISKEHLTLKGIGWRGVGIWGFVCVSFGGVFCLFVVVVDFFLIINETFFP